MFGSMLAKYCIALRKDSSVFVFVFVSWFNLLIATVFALFGLIPSCEIVCLSRTDSFW